ncbi:hypothetical protein BH20ACI2_BH20ACI2_24380 [soil metagenome]
MLSSKFQVPDSKFERLSNMNLNMELSTKNFQVLITLNLYYRGKKGKNERNDITCSTHRINGL